MGNPVQGYTLGYNRARKALEKSLELLDQDDCGIAALQTLKVDDSMAEIFKEKPVILIQSMNVRVMITKQIYSALRELDQIDMKLYREAVLKSMPKKRF